MKRTNSMAGRMLAVAGLVILLSSCIKLNMDLTVSTDNTVSGSAIVAVDKQLLALSGQPVDEIFGGDTIAPEGTEGLTTSDYEDDTFVGQEITFDGVPIAALSELEDADALKIAREGDVFTVTGALDMTNDTGGADANEAVQNALSSADISISITFPGPVASSNGEINGNTVSWTPKLGERTELQAQASAIPSGSSSSPVLWIVIAAVAVLVVIGAVLMMRRRSAATADGPSDGATLEAPPVSEMPVVAESAPQAAEPPVVPEPPAATTVPEDQT